MDHFTMSALGIIVALLAVYFLPALIALARRVRGLRAIFIANLLTGWTLEGWLGMFAAALEEPLGDKKEQSEGE